MKTGISSILSVALFTFAGTSLANDQGTMERNYPTLNRRPVSLCSGTFAGYYQGISQPLSFTFTRSNYPGYVNVIIAFSGRTWTGAGTCFQNDPYFASVNLNINDAPIHAGTISVNNGQVVFAGSQNPGYPFYTYRQGY